MSHPTGMAGHLAAAFIRSKLTPLLIISSILLGAWAVIALPREEEPQIIVPMIDVFVDLPGASPSEIEQRITRPLEQRLWEVPGLEYLYSTSSPGRAMLIARFLVGEDEERALVRLNQKLDAAAGILPAGASKPLVQARSIDDVPVMAFTLWGPGYDAAQLRLIGAQLRDTLKEVPDTSEITVIGGQPRQVTIELDPPALEARGLDPLRVQAALARSNVRTSGATVVAGNEATIVEAGNWPGTVEALRDLVVGDASGVPVRLGDVAAVIDGGAEPSDFVAFHASATASHPAVTLAIAKRKGTNAIDLTTRLQQKVDSLRGYLLPADLNVTVTRDYGDTAAHKSNELLFHMVLAVISVSLRPSANHINSETEMTASTM